MGRCRSSSLAHLSMHWNVPHASRPQHFCSVRGMMTVSLFPVHRLVTEPVPNLEWTETWLHPYGALQHHRRITRYHAPMIV